MHWIAPSEKDTAAATLEKRLWDTADQFRPKKCEVRFSKCGQFDNRNSQFAICIVRQSEFVIRHCPGLWIQLFHSALNAKGRAGFVMANSASDARASEQELF